MNKKTPPILSLTRKLTAEQVFIVTILLVNGGNYLYNLLLGRILGPDAFADAAILITFLLILSFMGMTFQIVSAKYAVVLEKNNFLSFIKMMVSYAAIIGIIMSALVLFFNTSLQEIFQTKTPTMFVVFGFGIPIYFIMSVNRGLFQGEKLLEKLALTYQTEMVSRLAFTVLPILLLPNINHTIIVALGITISLIFGIFPVNKSIIAAVKIDQPIITVGNEINKKEILTFFMLTAFYEFTQIIINNSDIILVKHYFNNNNAGLYASLALIGRVVYFVAWMFVMLLLPKVIQLKKEGKETQSILIKYVVYTTILATCIIVVSFLFPELVVSLMFGEQYIPIAFLLWKYALATSVFAVSNIFAYYFLSINQYIPVVVAAIIGFTQIVLIVLFHNSLEQVVEMQILAMVALLAIQFLFFLYQNKKTYSQK